MVSLAQELSVTTKPLTRWQLFQLERVTSYSKGMIPDLSFSINKDRQDYEQAINQTERLDQAGKPIETLNQKLIETNNLLNNASSSLLELEDGTNPTTADSTSTLPWTTVRELVKGIVADIRLSHAKIKVINNLINNLSN